LPPTSPHVLRRARAAVLVSLLTAATLAVVGTQPAVAAPTPVLKWSRELPGAVIRGSSPLAVDLDGGGLDVLVGSYDGGLYGFNGTTGGNAPGWPQQLGHAIQASPSTADVDNNGTPEIFTGTGLASTERPPGNFFSLTNNGGVRFKFTGSDPDNPTQAVQATAPIGDTNSDGTPDVPFGTMGLTMHNLTATSGGQNGGWPFYTDDSVFSSAALADVNGDGQTDIVVGGDASPGGPVDHRGGMVRAISGNGSLLWEFRVNEIVYSSPAVGDLDGDGRLEIAVGTGDYWQRNGGASDSTRFYLLNSNGTVRWVKDTGLNTTASPALADVNGDGRRDIVQAVSTGNEARVLAWDVSGAELRNIRSPAGAVIGSPTTGDFDNDGGQDILVPTGGGIFAYSGKTGAELFNLGRTAGGVAYQNSPLVTDIDGNGVVDIVVAGTRGANNNGQVERYEVAGGVLGANGWHTWRFDARRTGSLTNPPMAANLCGPPGSGGYWMVARDGGIFAFCDAKFHGSMGGTRLNQPVVGMASTKSGNGYWLVAADGGIFSFGDAAPRFFGSTGAIRLNSPIVGMARTPSGEGYWLVAADGGIFAFGDAKFFGSTGAIRLNSPVVGMASTPDGGGYWLVAADGGMFAFGNATFRGSMGGTRLNSPVVGMTARRDGSGYWLVAADGGLFAFGNAPFRGSMGGQRLNLPVVGMSVSSDDAGYRLVASDGGIFSFGAPFFGSTGSIKLNQPVVGMGVPGL
jgi:hypothetical protein